MVEVSRLADLQSLPGPVHLAIGVFDGVHVGHQAVIAHALGSAKSSAGSACVVTFDPHPASVVRPGGSPALLTSTRHKLRLLAGLGVAHTLVIPFDREFAATPPAEFIARLAAACALRQICVGEDWAFGKGRSGNVALLRGLGAQLGFDAVAIPGVAVFDDPVSSTAIRAAVQRGDLAGARRMLGRDFSVLGTVFEGRKLGRTLGFPTANLRIESEQLPPDGVYAVFAEVDGRRHAAVANVGVRPTLADSDERRVEVHLFDADADLYGREIEASFIAFLRPERKFDGLDALKAAIAQDAAQAREILAE